MIHAAQRKEGINAHENTESVVLSATINAAKDKETEENVIIPLCPEEKGCDRNASTDQRRIGGKGRASPSPRDRRKTIV